MWTILGIPLATWLSVCGSFLGPFVAVMIAVKLEPRKAQRSQRTQTLRTLLTLREAPYDAGFHTAINTIPVDFKGKAKVLAAHRAYIRATNATDTQNPQVLNATARERLKGLIMSMAELLKYPIDAEFLDTLSYRPQAHADLVALDIQSRRAWVRIADALELQTAALMPAEATQLLDGAPERQ